MKDCIVCGKIQLEINVYFQAFFSKMIENDVILDTYIGEWGRYKRQ